MNPITVNYKVFCKIGWQLKDEDIESFIQRYRLEIAKKIGEEYRYDCYKEFVQMPTDVLKEYLSFEITNLPPSTDIFADVPVTFDYPKFRQFVYECQGRTLPEEETKQESAEIEEI